MKTIKFTNESLRVNVSYVTDLIKSADDNFTIYQVIQESISGNRLIDSLTREVQQLGFKKRLDKFTVKQCKDFAVANNLSLNIYDGVPGTETLNSFTAIDITSEIDISIVGSVSQVETITLPATAAATQGDYVVMMNTAGEFVAAWLDIDADGTEPTGDNFTAVENQVKVSIVTGGTATQNAALLAEALEGNIWLTDVTILDNEDGTVTFTQNIGGAIIGFDVSNADDSGAGSISTSVDTAGTNGEELDIQLEAEGGIEPYMWISNSTFPNGVFFTGDGKLVGRADELGEFDVDITVIDKFNTSKTVEFTITSASE